MFKIGIIGAGGIAQHHEEEIAKLDDCKIVAVCDIREDAAREIAQKHRAKVFTDYRDLLSADVDIVYILTPPFLHKEMAIAAAEAGKHIFIEKPLALNYEDCLEIKDAVDRAGVKCQVGYVVGYNPPDDTARRLFKEKKIGNLVFVWDKRMSAGILNSSLGTHKEWICDKNKGGGHLLECMTHEIQWLLSVGGEVESVYANIQATNRDPRVTADDNCWAILKFKNGGIGVLGTSWSCPINSVEKGILGTEGVVQMSNRKVILANKNKYIAHEVEAVPDIEMSKQAHFNKCIKENLKPFNSIDEAVYNIKVIMAMHESSLKNEVIRL